MFTMFFVSVPCTCWSSVSCTCWSQVFSRKSSYLFSSISLAIFFCCFYSCSYFPVQTFVFRYVFVFEWFPFVHLFHDFGRLPIFLPFSWWFAVVFFGTPLIGSQTLFASSIMFICMQCIFKKLLFSSVTIVTSFKHSLLSLFGGFVLFII